MEGHKRYSIVVAIRKVQLAHFLFVTLMFERSTSRQGQNRKRVMENILKRIFGKWILGTLLALLPVGASAADVTEPVRVIMGIAEKIWAEGSRTQDWYFDDTRLNSVYSKSFVAQYREAEKHPVFDTDTGVGTPFDYDVIANAQDGCPLKDIVYKVVPGSNGKTEVQVTFNNQYCLDPTYAGDLTNVNFEVITEDGKAAIDDIVVEGEDPEKATDSLKAIMADIVKG